MQVVTDKRYATNSGYIDEIEPENHKGKQKKAIGLTTTVGQTEQELKLIVESIKCCHARF